MGIGDIINGIRGSLVDDGGADYIAIHEGLTLAGEIAGKITGFLAVIILVGMPIMVALEELYINFPIFQLKCDEICEEHNRMEKLIGVCLRDARKAVYIANTRETGRSVNVEYIKIKAKMILISMFIVGIIVWPTNLILRFIIVQVQNILRILSGAA